MHAAVSSEAGIMRIPLPDYRIASSFGSLELRQRAGNEYIGQPIDYSDANMVAIRKMAIDGLALPRVDLIKVDIEGMEMEALEGARVTIRRAVPSFWLNRSRPAASALRSWLEQRGYQALEAGINVLAIHKSDTTLAQLKIAEAPAQSSAA
jgi:Methyltransferase FkbM domain